MSRLVESGGARPGRIGLIAVVAVAILCSVLLSATSALASSRWRPAARPAPTQLPLTGEGFVDVVVAELGDTAVSATASPITIADVLPEGLTAISVAPRRQFTAINEGSGGEQLGWHCFGPGESEVKGAREVKCTYDPSAVLGKNLPVPAGERRPIGPYDSLELPIRVEVNASPGEFQNEVLVSGGREAQVENNKVVGEGAEVTPETLKSPFTVSGGQVQFGVEPGGYSVSPEDSSGHPEVKAGAHPFQLSTKLNFTQTFEELPVQPLNFPSAPALTRNLHINLPPGLLGNVTAVPQCTDVNFSTERESGNQCEADTAIGVARVSIEEPTAFTLLNATVPVFNLVPAAGEPARFGFFVYHVPVILDTHVRTGDETGSAGGGDYGVEVSVSNVTQLSQILGSEVTLWGAPGDPTHDQARGWSCVDEGAWEHYSSPCAPPSSRPTAAFLTLPTSCTSPLSTTVTGESWPFKAATENGLGQTSTLQASYEFASGFEDCGALPFTPSIKLKPTTTEANSPTGLEVDVHVPQDTTLNPSGRAESALRATTVVLPEGVQLSPSAANGLEACSESQIGYQGPGRKDDPYSPNEQESMRFTTAPVTCPAGSKVGTVKVKTPLLKNELEGAVYLAAPAPLKESGKNPFDSLVALYIVAEDPPAVVANGEASGIRVKIAGEVKLNPDTGQITSTFNDTPQVPFEDFIVNFNSGPRASVSTPPLCGSYVTGASFTAWAEGRVQPAATDPGEFAVGSGPAGSGCSNPQPFAPSFTAGSTNLQAGGFTPFAVTINRPDTDQALKAVSVTLPPGAAAILASATQCGEQQANEGTCGPDSLIGHATAVSGLGPNPFTVTGGRVYITGPYNGAPFGLSIVTPAVAGPFDLGEVVVRSGIYVDKTTAAVTINTSLPTIVQGVGRPKSGVPLQLRSINVVVDRPNFEFNPTNCTPMAVTVTLSGIAGATHTVSAPFQVANCAALPFHPTLTASTQGNASKANGASLTVKVSSSTGQANIAKTRLVLPIQLPSRLTTIQKACPDSKFENNPASCEEGSNIGTATVHTPVLKSPLTGPAYLVSHGNAAFPDVEFVLQGEGITLILDGQTDIKKGITTSTFNAVPDAPVTTFETTLPEGPHSALTSNVAQSKRFSLCGAKLVMPTTITGQNGVVIQQDTKIPVGGCKAAVQETKAQKLKKALKACHKKFKHSKKKRSACEKQARKKYGAKKKAKSKKAAKHK
jgi:hypothetical protein